MRLSDSSKAACGRYCGKGLFEAPRPLPLFSPLHRNGKGKGFFGGLLTPGGRSELDPGLLSCRPAGAQAGQRLLLVALCCFCLVGCTFRRAAQGHVAASVAFNQVKLDEEARTLTTALVDVLALAPTNQHVSLALDLAQHAQQIEGIPTQRMDVNALLAEQDAAWDALKTRYQIQNSLLTQKAALTAKLRDSEAKLIEMGKLYEAEKNRSIVKRIWHLTIGTLGIGGVIALCVFCPALIPLGGAFVSWLIGKVPALASLFGVVGKRAFDAVVKGVGQAKEKLKETHPEADEILGTELEKATDAEHRVLIQQRRAILKA